MNFRISKAILDHLAQTNEARNRLTRIDLYLSLSSWLDLLDPKWASSQSASLSLSLSLEYISLFIYFFACDDIYESYLIFYLQVSSLQSFMDLLIDSWIRSVSHRSGPLLGTRRLRSTSQSWSFRSTDLQSQKTNTKVDLQLKNDHQTLNASKICLWCLSKSDFLIWKVKILYMLTSWYPFRSSTTPFLMAFLT